MQTDLLLDSFLWSHQTRKDLNTFMQSSLRGEQAHAHDALTLIFGRFSTSYAKRSSRFEEQASTPPPSTPPPIVGPVAPGSPPPAPAYDSNIFFQPPPVGTSSRPFGMNGIEPTPEPEPEGTSAEPQPLPEKQVDEDGLLTGKKKGMKGKKGKKR